MVKILRLTTSNDTVHQGPESRVGWLQRLGEERLGEPLEIVSRAVWPDARLPAAAEKWIEREQPDIVWLVLQSFWFEYLSVPKRLERKFGRVGKVASEAGFKAADKPLVANNFAFRQGRKLLQRTIGGDPHFAIDPLFETIEGLARVSLRNEGRQFVVWGPFSYHRYWTTTRQRDEALAWRTELIRRIRALAGDLHFYAEASDRPFWETERKRVLHGDQFHMGVEEQRELAERELELLARIIAGVPA